MYIRAGKGTMSPPKVTKLFSMAKECLERAEAIYPTLQALALSREAAASPPRNIPPPGPNQHMQEQKQHHQQQHTSPGSHKQQEGELARVQVHIIFTINPLTMEDFEMTLIF